MTDIKYQYAIDERGKHVSINDYTKEDSKLHSFTCIGCGQTLLPRAINSKYKRPHFYHKDPIECNGETYLHHLAKIMIKNKFDNSEKFQISFERYASCNAKDCKYRHYSCESKREFATLDLKIDYNQCYIEKHVTDKEGHEYIADLLLSNTNSSITPPILLEILVTHECSIEKKDSGLKIIEIIINSEDDIDKLCNSDIIYADGDKIKIFGFIDTLTTKLTQSIRRAYHIPGKRIQFKYIKCEDADKKLFHDSDLEVNISPIECKEDYVYNIDVREIDIENYLSKRWEIKECAYCNNYNIELYPNHPFCIELGLGVNTPESIDSCYIKKEIDVEKIMPAFFQNDFNYVKNNRKSRPLHRVLIMASQAFINDNLLMHKSDEFLSNESNYKNVVIYCILPKYEGGGAGSFSAIEYAKKRCLLYYFYGPNWERDGKRAIYILYNQILKIVDSLIYFWNGDNQDINYHVYEEAKQNGKKVCLINYGEIKDLCPICGSKMQIRNVKGVLYNNCVHYPQCNGRRPLDKNI